MSDSAWERLARQMMQEISEAIEDNLLLALAVDGLRRCHYPDFDDRMDAMTVHHIDLSLLALTYPASIDDYRPMFTFDAEDPPRFRSSLFDYWKGVVVHDHVYYTMPTITS